MTYQNLYDLIPRAFWNAVDGYWLDKENDDRREWERCRWQTTYLLNVHLPKSKHLKPQKLLPFYWEEEEETEKNTYEETLFEYEKFMKKQNLNKSE